MSRKGAIAADRMGVDAGRHPERVRGPHRSSTRTEAIGSSASGIVTRASVGAGAGRCRGGRARGVSATGHRRARAGRTPVSRLSTASFRRRAPVPLARGAGVFPEHGARLASGDGTKLALGHARSRSGRGLSGPPSALRCARRGSSRRTWVQRSAPRDDIQGDGGTAPRGAATHPGGGGPSGRG
jgi:hypothetical protein